MIRNFHAAALPYARAMFDWCEEKGVTDLVFEEWHYIDRALESTPDLQRLFDHSTMLPLRRQKILDALFLGKLHPATYKMIRFLNSKRRLSIMTHIFEQFKCLVLASRGKAEIPVITADPLLPDFAKQLSRILSRKFSLDVIVRPETNPRIIAGLMWEHDGKLYDASVWTQLKRFYQTVVATL